MIPMLTAWAVSLGGHVALPNVLHIAWREAAPYPHVLNGGMVGKTDGWVVYTCGFGRRATAVEKVDGYTRHTMGYEIARNRWVRLPDFPGAARAYGTASGLYGNGWVYVLGGQSYTEPFVYRDGWRIRRRDGAWAWQKLPDLPHATAEFGACLLGAKIYLQGGAFYGQIGEDPRTRHWCSVTGDVGRKFLSLDLRHIDRGWSVLPRLPGVGRNHHVLASAAGKLYVLGGIATVPKKGGKRWERVHHCVVDNWQFDPRTNQWQRVRDLPYGLGGHAALTYKDRWILLFGGYDKRTVLRVDGSVTPEPDEAAGFQDRVLVYDAKADRFGRASPMLHAINDPRVVWLDEETVFVATGEIPQSRRIPDCQIGSVRRISHGDSP